MAAAGKVVKIVDAATLSPATANAVLAAILISTPHEMGSTNGGAMIYITR
jgi:hypothetical protein